MTRDYNDEIDRLMSVYERLDVQLQSAIAHRDSAGAQLLMHSMRRIIEQTRRLERVDNS